MFGCEIKMKKLRILFAVLLFIMVSSCASTITNINNVMESWKGQHFSNLIEKCGPPEKILDDGQGGQIYCYEFSRVKTDTGLPVIGVLKEFLGITALKPKTITEWRMFWINSEGYIYRWALKE